MQITSANQLLRQFLLAKNQKYCDQKKKIKSNITTYLHTRKNSFATTLVNCSKLRQPVHKKNDNKHINSIQIIKKKQNKQEVLDVHRSKNGKCSDNCKCKGKLQIFQKNEDKRISALSNMNQSKQLLEEENIKQKRRRTPLKLKITLGNIKEEINKEQKIISDKNSSKLKSKQNTNQYSNQYKLIQSMNACQHRANYRANQSSQNIANKDLFKDQTKFDFPKSHAIKRSNRMHTEADLLNYSPSKNRITSKQSNRMYTGSDLLNYSPNKKKITSKQIRQSIMNKSKNSMNYTPQKHQTNTNHKNNNNIIQSKKSSFLIKDQTQCKNILQDLYEKIPKNQQGNGCSYFTHTNAYKNFSLEQLNFIGTLFDSIDHRQLNNITFDNFYQNTLKFCKKEFQVLINALKQQNLLNGEQFSFECL